MLFGGYELPGKYDVVNDIGNDKYAKSIPNDGSWIIGTVISFLAIAVPPFLAFDWWEAIVSLLKSADIVMFFVSTVIALLVSCSWEEQQKQRHLWLMAYMIFAALLYGGISYSEYAGKELNVYIVCLLNVAMFSVMGYIIYKAYRGRKGMNFRRESK